MLTSPSPHDFPPNPIEKPGYVLEFQDEFEGPEIDTHKWFPYYMPHWSSRALSAPSYSLQDGCLVLQIAQDQNPWCPEFDGPVRCSAIQTGSYAGPLGSEWGQHRFKPACRVREAQPPVQTYTPQYGYFEVRARGLRSSGCLAALWMIGYEEVPEQSGEIALFELAGALTGETTSTLRYGMRAWSDPHLTDAFYEVQLPLDTSHFHIYAVEWLPTQVDFYVDNVRIRSLAQSPHYPMQFMLTVYELPLEGIWTGPVDPADPYPKTFAIDYFRGYQPLGGYR
jgi:hypothetical protein